MNRKGAMFLSNDLAVKQKPNAVARFGIMAGAYLTPSKSLRTWHAELLLESVFRNPSPSNVKKAERAARLLGGVIENGCERMSPEERISASTKAIEAWGRAAELKKTPLGRAEAYAKAADYARYIWDPKDMRLTSGDSDSVLEGKAKVLELAAEFGEKSARIFAENGLFEEAGKSFSSAAHQCLLLDSVYSGLKQFDNRVTALDRALRLSEEAGRAYGASSKSGDAMRLYDQARSLSRLVQTLKTSAELSERYKKLFGEQPDPSLNTFGSEVTFWLAYRGQ